MTLQPPRRKQPAASQQEQHPSARMSLDAARVALAETAARISAHAAVCEQCAAAKIAATRRTGFTLWYACETGRALLRHALAYEHRIYYLGRVVARKPKKAGKARRTAQEGQEEGREAEATL